MQHPIAVKFKKSPLIATGIKIDPDTWIIKRFAFTPSLTYCPIYCLFKTKFHSRKVLAYVNKYRFKARYLHESQTNSKANVLACFSNPIPRQGSCMSTNPFKAVVCVSKTIPWQGTCMCQQTHFKVLACVSKPISRCLHESANPFQGKVIGCVSKSSWSGFSHYDCHFLLHQNLYYNEHKQIETKHILLK